MAYRMLLFSFVTFIFIAPVYNSVPEKEDVCSAIKQPLDRAHFATKTAYEAAINKDTLINVQFQEEVSETCGGTAQLLWLVTRHGIRYPVKSEIMKMGATLPLLAQELVFNSKEGRGCLSEADVKELENFVPPYGLQDSGQLHEAGADEQFSLGEFWKREFPQIFAEPYDEKYYKVEFTTMNRTGQSAYHFLRGMFGDDAVARINLPKPRSPNYKLRAYISCPAWQSEVKNNKETYREQRLFQQHPDFLAMVDDVTKRLGYTQAVNLDELMLIYSECRFEAAWWPHRHSVWCKVFSNDDLQVLEYHQALSYYYEDSYGGPELNAQITCAAAADLYKRMKAAVEDSSEYPRALLYFSHDKALLQLQTLLGLHRPAQHLTHSNRQLYKHSPFQISYIAPFSTNLAFVLYKCRDGSHRVGGMLQGAPISLATLCPAADGEQTQQRATCPWPPPLLKEIADNCAVRRLCNKHDEL